MKFSILSFCLLASAFAWGSDDWDTDDFEIFDLMDELRSLPLQEEGANFYTALSLEPSATQAEINKASRKKALELHRMLFALYF